MGRITKHRKAAMKKHDSEKEYALADATKLIREISFVKFDASVDVDVRLGVNPKKADQMVRGVVTLPHGLGKDVRVLCLCSPDKEQEAKDAGAEYVGLDDYIKKIETGWLAIDVIVTMPAVMAKVGRLGKILGPRGLMPNPKSGTVTMDIGKAVKEIKAGKVDFKLDKQGIIHASVGRVSFTPKKIEDNVTELLQTISKMKPSSAKGEYFRSLNISSTMSPSIRIDTSTISGL